jgi:hypothetical protein
MSVGLAWRPELAWTIDRNAHALAITEFVVENFDPRALPRPLLELARRGMSVVPHGIGLSLGSGDRPDRARIDRLARAADAVGAPFVSEHIAFVRAGGRETEHLLPVPRTRDALEIVIENVREAIARLPVPLVLENIAHVFEWPEDEMEDAEFVGTVLRETGALLLLDVANLAANARNFGWNPTRWLDRIPLDRVAYVHVAGGVPGCDGFYHDTHEHPVADPALALLAEVSARIPGVPILLERDGNFGTREQIEAELGAIAAIVEGARRVA